MNNNKFCVLFSTKSTGCYHNLLKDLIYKFNIPSFDDVVVLNVDIDSEPSAMEYGEKICKDLNINYIHSSLKLHSHQESIELADNYLQENNIDVDWILYIQHDCVFLEKDFWDQANDIINNNNDWLKEKVGMFGGSTYVWTSAPYSRAKTLSKHENKITRAKSGTLSGRGVFIKDIHENPYYRWYRQLPNSYYEVDHFVVEVPNWNFTFFNRKLYREHITPDPIMKQDLWADDLAHQFLLNNVFNITFPHLVASTDHGLKRGIVHNTDNLFIRNKRSGMNPHKRFLEKNGFGWIRNHKEIESKFKLIENKYENPIQSKLLQIKISDGPKQIKDFE